MLNKFKCLILILAVQNAFGQIVDRSAEIRAAMWDSGDEKFSINTVPEKWTNESAVIIAQSDERAYRKPPIIARLIEQEHFHQRVKIQDQNALEKYSQFTYSDNTYFRGIQRKIYVGFKIIKPDGKEIIVPESEAVKEDFETSGSFKLTRLKLAIPNLEVGDILDYYLAEEYDRPVATFYSFDPAIFVLRKEYPLMYGKVSFAVLRRCYINLKSYNNAPDFVLSKEDGEEDVYVLDYQDQEKIEDVPWFYPYRSLPTVKFKITYASPSGAYQVPSLLNKQSPGELKSNVKPREVESLINSYMSRLPDVTGLKRFMKRNFKNEKNKSVLAKEAYLHQRNALSIQSAEIRTIRGSEILNISPYYMVANLGRYFQKTKIPYKLIVGVPKSIGTIEDIIVEDELMLGLKTDTEPPIYVTSYSPHSLPNELNAAFDGLEVYISDKGIVSGGYYDFVKTTLPQSKAIDNVASQDMTLTIDLDALKVEMKIVKTLTGLQRSYEQNQLMDIYDYKEEEQFKYEMKSITYGQMQSLADETRNLIKEYQESRPKKLHERLMEMNNVSYDFEIDTIRSFQILETGRSEEQPRFKYEYILSSEDLISKAGKNYLFDVGKLIEEQIKIEIEHKTERDFDVYMSYPRSFQSVISVDIPEGYTVQGLDKLNRNVMNETGGFKSNFELKDNILLISTTKHYTNNFEPASNWSKMIAFLDEANDFSEVQVLLRKKE